MREISDSPFIVSSDQGTLSVGIIVIRAIIVTVPFHASFVLDAVSFLTLVLNSTVCVSVADDIPQVSFVLTLAALLRWSDAAG
jgi:hypothetical protein